MPLDQEKASLASANVLLPYFLPHKSPLEAMRKIVEVRGVAEKTARLYPIGFDWEEVCKGVLCNGILKVLKYTKVV